MRFIIKVLMIPFKNKMITAVVPLRFTPEERRGYIRTCKKDVYYICVSHHEVPVYCLCMASYSIKILL